MDLRLTITLLAIGALAVSGCSSKNNDSTATGDGNAGGGAGNTSGTTGAGTTEPGNGGGATGGAGNSTKELTCTATAGGPGNGYVGVGGQNVGGCSFGAAPSQVTLLAADLPSGCNAYQTAPGGGPNDAQPAKVGDSYPKDTDFSMFCGPGGIQLTGKITLQT